jgi:hypothetical protein
MDFLIFERQIHGDISILYTKTKDWIKKKRGTIVREDKSTYVYAENYRDSWDFHTAGNSIEIELSGENDEVTVRVSIPKVGVTTFMLFLKAYNMVYLMSIEEYFRFINFKFAPRDLRELYPIDYLVEMMFASLFPSGFLLCARAIRC